MRQRDYLFLVRWSHISPLPCVSCTEFSLRIWGITSAVRLLMGGEKKTDFVKLCEILNRLPAENNIKEWRGCVSFLHFMYLYFCQCLFLRLTLAFVCFVWKILNFETPDSQHGVLFFTPKDHKTEEMSRRLTWWRPCRSKYLFSTRSICLLCWGMLINH